MSDIPAETVAALAASVAAIHEQIAENRSQNAKHFAELQEMMRSIHATLKKELRSGSCVEKKGDEKLDYKLNEIAQSNSSVDPQPLMDIAKDGDFAGKSSFQPQPVLPMPQSAPLMSPNQSSITQQSAMKHAQGKELHQVGRANTPFHMPRVYVPQFCGADGEERFFPMAMGMSKIHNNEIHISCFVLFSSPRPPEWKINFMNLEGKVFRRREECYIHGIKE